MYNDSHDIVLLAQASNGYITVCTCCGTLNLLFNNIALNFTEDEFYYFKNYFDDLQERRDKEVDLTEQNVYMSTPVKNMLFCFSLLEIRQLKRLLAEASIMLQVFKILNNDMAC